MSDFDREAERERLREKYGEDDDDREATERMSDLLLKGATMTNAHCGTCGDPIFRYEGEEFCPTCQEVVGEEADAGDADQTPGENGDSADAAAQPAEADGQPEPAATSQPAPETGEQAATGSTGAGATTEDAPDDAPDRADARSPESTTAAESAPVQSRTKEPGQRRRTPPESGADEYGRRPSDGPAPETGGHQRSQPVDAGAGSLGAARASLTRTVTTLAQRAEHSDDLERTRAYLAAVEEAADALAAVERADK